VWDYHIWYSGNGNDKTPRDALLLAAKQHHVQQRLALFEDAKVRVHTLQSDCVALYNFYRFAFDKPETSDTLDPCVMLVDVGADGTNFVIGDRQSLWFRSVPRGGDDFNRSVMRQFEATFATAEQLKRSPTKARHISKLHDAWKPTFAQLLKDLRDSMDAFAATDRRRTVAGVYALGGSFRTHGLHRHFLGGP
jgi:Tfp pilus assembly PilM family ATPase